MGLDFGDVKALVNGTVIADGTGAPKSTLTFNPFTAVDLGQSRIAFASPHNLKTGDPVVYTSGNGGPIGGLEDQATYYAIKVDDSTIQLAASREDANNGKAIAFEVYPTLAGGGGQRPRHDHERDGGLDRLRLPAGRAGRPLDDRDGGDLPRRRRQADRRADRRPDLLRVHRPGRSLTRSA